MTTNTETEIVNYTVHIEDHINRIITVQSQISTMVDMFCDAKPKARKPIFKRLVDLSSLQQSLMDDMRLLVDIRSKKIDDLSNEIIVAIRSRTL